MMAIAADNFTESAAVRKKFIAVAESIKVTVDRLIPGTPPDGDRDIVLTRQGKPRVLWQQVDFNSTRYRISLDALMDKWWQVTFQFSHELGHVKMGPSRSNLLLEVFANAISLEVIRRVPKQWTASPPFKRFDWSHFADGHGRYHDEILTHFVNTLPRSADRPDTSNREAAVIWLNEHSPSVISRPLDDNLSRVWQIIAANSLLSEVFDGNDDRWFDLLCIAQHTEPSPADSPHFRDDLKLLADALPSWVPQWLRSI